MGTERPKKILYIITKSNFGGAQKYVLTMATAAQAAGHDVSVACGGTGTRHAPLGEMATRLQKKDIPVYRIHHFMRNMSLWQDVQAGIELYRLIKNERPDVVHTNSSKAGGVGALAARLSGVNLIVFTAHGLAIDETWRPRWQQWLIALATWFTFLLSHHVIVINSDAATRSKKLLGQNKKIHLIFNGVEPVPLLTKTESRQRLWPNKHADSFWIGGIGELHPNKNWSSLIEAMTLLPSDICLFIISDGQEREALQSQINTLHLTERVTLLGHIDEASTYLRAFDIFTLPSKKEGLPYVLLEAGSASLPVVASSLPGIHDIVKDSYSGLLTDPTPQKLANKIQALYYDAHLREQFGSRLNETIKKDFSQTKMTDETLALYETRTSSA